MYVRECEVWQKKYLKIFQVMHANVCVLNNYNKKEFNSLSKPHGGKAHYRAQIATMLFCLSQAHIYKTLDRKKIKAAAHVIFFFILNEILIFFAMLWWLKVCLNWDDGPLCVQSNNIRLSSLLHLLPAVSFCLYLLLCYAILYFCLHNEIIVHTFFVLKRWFFFSHFISAKKKWFCSKK